MFLFPLFIVCVVLLLLLLLRLFAFNKSEFVTTATELKAIMAPEKLGFKLIPYSGKNAPAANGIPIAL